MSKTETEDELYYLRDSRSDCGSSAMFWALKGGYTTDLSRAEKFTRKRAVNQYNCRRTDVPLRCDLIDPLSHFAVDSQYITDAAQLASNDPMAEYVLQIPRQWDGNSIAFVGFETEKTFNYGNSKIVFIDTINRKQNIRLLKSEIDKIARPVVEAEKINTTTFLKAAKIKIKKTRKVREGTGKYRYNCPACHKFVWSYNPYDESQCYKGKCRFL